MSKAALNAFTRILASTYRDARVLVNAVDPGWVRTDMGGPSAPRSPQEGADTIVWLATLPDDGPTGGYLLSYPFAALVAGLIAAKFSRRSLLIAFSVGAVACSVLVFASGALWLATALHKPSRRGSVARGSIVVDSRMSQYARARRSIAEG